MYKGKAYKLSSKRVELTNFEARFNALEKAAENTLKRSKRLLDEAAMVVKSGKDVYKQAASIESDAKSIEKEASQVAEDFKRKAKEMGFDYRSSPQFKSMENTLKSLLQVNSEADVKQYISRSL